MLNRCTWTNLHQKTKTAHTGPNDGEQSTAFGGLHRAWREEQILEVLGRDAGGKTRFNCRLSATRCLNERDKFTLRGSSVPCVLVITQNTAGGRCEYKAA